MYQFRNPTKNTPFASRANTKNQAISRDTASRSIRTSEMTTMTPTIHRSDDFIMSLDNTCPPGIPLYLENYSPDCVRTQMWIDGATVQSYGESLPTMPKTPHFVTSSSAFQPLNPTNNSVQRAINIPRTSPFEYRKHSPTPSHHSSTTAETSSFKSISSLDSLHPSSYNGFMPMWIGPRDANVCRVLEESFNRARSPLTDLTKVKNARRDDDPVRKSRLKTEMCMHYENGTYCPFGANCTYAHGVEELQMTKLMDMHRAGLAELESYRTKPCLTWISTGSCPFGKRCSCIHDPRAAGTQQSWLPHTETQGNTIATDINVEAVHQKRLYAIQYNNPFGDLFHVDLDVWEDLYKLVCNIPTVRINNRRKNLAEYHKVDIALQMRGSSDWQYKFRPQHIIYDELCMVLQKRAFRLTENGAVEIPLSVYNSKRFNNQVVVREIAFGPDCDPTVRGVSLWFDIDDKDVTVCTPQQAKRYRWKKGLKGNNSPRSSPFKPKTSTFDSKECFVMVRALDKDAYDLSTRILAHHLGLLRSERIANLSDRWEARSALQVEGAALKETFENLKKHWQSWAWPINEGRGKVDEHTPVPPIDGEYNPKASVDDKGGGVGTNPVVQRIWDSFMCDNIAPLTYSRLPVLETLATGTPVSNGGGMPHILKRFVKKRKKTSVTSDSERCWKALLLTPVYPQYEANEWKAVLEHFSNSRSKKVLGILQSSAPLSPQ